MPCMVCIVEDAWGKNRLWHNLSPARLANHRHNFQLSRPVVGTLQLYRLRFIHLLPRFSFQLLQHHSTRPNAAIIHHEPPKDLIQRLCKQTKGLFERHANNIRARVRLNYISRVLSRVKYPALADKGQISVDIPDYTSSHHTLWRLDRGPAPSM